LNVFAYIFNIRKIIISDVFWLNSETFADPCDKRARKGKTEKGWLQDSYVPPSKTQYVNALAKRISEKEINATLQEISQSTKKKRSSS
jgi:hypothetical protein